MKIGFAKEDITPRVGVELCGFGPFLCRHSIGIRDRLWARAMAVEADGAQVVIISCDLIGLSLSITRKVRERLSFDCGLAPESVFLCCSHTHSGPATGAYIGWGETDLPYLETLPARLVRAGKAALAARAEAELFHASVPCEGIGVNREYEKPPTLEAVLDDEWRPEKPELTDTICQVICARDRGGRLLGFISSFGCHPVVCCAASRWIHGDYPGVATNAVERDYGAGVVGLFLQGAQGDVNTCVVHQPEQESLLALDVIAARYARSLRQGLQQAQLIDGLPLRTCRQTVSFSRKDWGLARIESLLAETEARLNHADSTDSFTADTWNVRMEMVYAVALRKLRAQRLRGESLVPESEVHGVRLGPIAILGSPFETFQAIGRDVLAKSSLAIPLVVSFVNDSLGYAPDRTCAARGGYAADMVPLIAGSLPFSNIHDELVQALLALEVELGDGE